MQMYPDKWSEGRKVELFHRQEQPHDGVMSGISKGWYPVARDPRFFPGDGVQKPIDTLSLGGKCVEHGRGILADAGPLLSASSSAPSLGLSEQRRPAAYKP